MHIGESGPQSFRYRKLTVRLLPPETHRRYAFDRKTDLAMRFTAMPLRRVKFSSEDHQAAL